METETSLFKIQANKLNINLDINTKKSMVGHGFLHIDHQRIYFCF